MEAGEIKIEGFENTMEITSSCSHIDTVTPVAQAEHFGDLRYEPPSKKKKKKKKIKANNQISKENDTPPKYATLSDIVVIPEAELKVEFAQKAGLMSPVYETIKEGPSHEPSFRSTVILNNVRYDSLPGFLNRKTAEQSAAEVALIELSKSADMKFGISQPVHQTGLCKNLLQEYAQKMNYAMPLYECYKEEKKQGRAPMYSCTVEIGGTKYIGASASSKKEAEIKAARTALLAIQSAPYFSEDHTGNSIYTVIPLKKKVSDLGISTQEISAALKPKKSRFKKQQKRKCASKRACFAKGTMASEQEANLNGLASLETGVSDDSGTQEKEAGGFEVNIDGQAVVETSVTNVVSFQLGTDSGHGVVETTANVSYEEFYNVNMENSLVQVDGGVCRDGESSRMDVHP